ncbi:response regulator [Pedobacter sp. MC2016-14]|uniref:response regulator n=1 Tax=Pedobacter sp. MC2016-14 TaxID=2897327 RepID=UPI001E546BF4|nr:response regulator [Pedobacter sp. MC2016-14]MCD0490022.1 response regulator [Pedobacter sp. MC2016-14]
MRKRLLIIDADQSICEEIAAACSANFNIKKSFGKENIFKLIDDFKPDVVLIEYVLPIHNGATLCDLVKLNPDTTKTPVILLSSVPLNEAITDCFCDSFISKPFKIEELQNIINYYCAKH